MKLKHGLSILALAVFLAAAWYLFFSGYGRTSRLGYEFAASVFSACNQRDLERLQRIERMIDEYRKKDEIHRAEYRWLKSIISLARANRWEKAELEARRLLNAQIDNRAETSTEPNP